MVLKGPHKTTEVATKDTEMGWKCDSKEERKGFEIQTKDKRTPPKSKRASVKKLSFIFLRQTRRIRKKSQYISFVFTGEMMLYC